jgi:hypothetical protein
MTLNVAIIGQSNGQNIASALQSELAAATGQSVSVIDAAVGGSSLLAQSVNTSIGANAYWLSRATGSPLTNFLTAISSVELAAVVHVYGENECAIGSPTEAQIVSGAWELYATICGAQGKEPGGIQIFASQVGNIVQAYPHGRAVAAAQLATTGFPGVRRGADYWDLPTEPDGVHIAASSRAVFAKRISDKIAALVGSVLASQTSLVREYTPNNSATGITGYSYRSHVADLQAGGSQVRVRFTAPSAGAMQLDHASIAIQASGADAVATPIELKFAGSSGVTVPAGGSTWSDWATMPFSSSDVLLVVIDIASANGNFRYLSPAPSGDGSYTKAATASWNQATVSGFAPAAAAVGFDRVEGRA